MQKCLLFQEICIAADRVCENDLYDCKWLSELHRAMFVVFVLSQLLVSHTHCDQRTPTARRYPDVFTPERCSPVLCCYCSDYLSCIECPQ